MGRESNVDQRNHYAAIVMRYRMRPPARDEHCRGRSFLEQISPTLWEGHDNSRVCLTLRESAYRMFEFFSGFDVSGHQTLHEI